MALLDATGILAVRSGRWEDAARDLEEALAMARRMGFPYGEGQSLYELGRMYAAREETDRARGHLSAALAIFDRLGAKPYGERTKRALEALPSDA